MMTPLVPATYEQGIFKPSAPVHLPEHLRVILAISAAEDDVPTMALSRLAEQSQSLAFLSDSREDLYTLMDGEPC
jgi:predicted DNA-binding antitoxin AbrB/MazE fold protein